MKELIFELSVLFTKTELTPFSDNERIIQGYNKFFGKEVDRNEIIKVIGGIIDEQIEYYGGVITDIPEDFELKRNDI